MANGHTSRAGTSRASSVVVGFLVCYPLIVWAAVLAAPALSTEGGIFNILIAAGNALQHPFVFTWTDKTWLCIVVFTVAYAMAAAIYLSIRKNWRFREEYGSAKWDTPSAVNNVFYDKAHPQKNLPITKHISMATNMYMHSHNLNTLVIGGSGSGKTRYLVLPQLMTESGCSFLVTDPKGELLTSTGEMFKSFGYKIRVLNLKDMAASDGYNPFHYIKSENDVQLIVENLFRNTTPPESRATDPYWDNMAKTLLMALMLYLWHYAPEEEQNFDTVMFLLTYVAKSDEDESMKSPIDILFERKKREEPNSLAVRYYELATKAPGRTMMSIVSSLVSHCDKFNLPEVAKLTIRDEMEIERLGKEPSITYVITPDDDTSFNFLAGMFYTQAIQTLERISDQERKPLPVHVRFMLDEFANIALPQSFQNSLSVFRSRNISACIILQALAQLKAKYEKDWESIVANCDTVLYLGGNESSTHEWLSKMLGKETIDTRTYNRSRGRNGNVSSNEAGTGRELLTQDEIRRMNRKDAIVIIGGYTAIDTKYPLNKHPNIALTTNGGAKEYVHNELIGSTQVAEEVELNENGVYEVLTSEELESYYKAS